MAEGANASDISRESVLRETLDALDLPRESVGAWLDQLERFYRGHGGARRYAECLDLVARLRALHEQRDA